jgi:hypothetical protein
LFFIFRFPFSVFRYLILSFIRFDFPILENFQTFYPQQINGFYLPIVNVLFDFFINELIVKSDARRIAMRCGSRRRHG